MNYYGQYRYYISKQLEGVPVDMVGAGMLDRPFPPVNEQDVENAQGVLYTERRLRDGLGLHIFIGEDEENVIRNAMKKLSYNQMVRFVPPMMEGIVYTTHNDPVLFQCHKFDGKSCLRIHMEDNGTLVSIQTEDHVDDQDYTHMRDDEKVMDEMMRLVYGMFMMKLEFPEIFIDGPPPSIKHPAWYRTLNKFHFALSRVRKDMAPHIRSGHFRLLSAERYVHKRGQLVFVRPSMVNGEAKHTEKG
jgi:hypothetical protein